MFSNRLRGLRESFDLKQKEAAEKLNIGQVTYNRYERGEREPDIDTLKKIANFYNVSIDYLLGNVQATSEHEPSDAKPDPDYLELHRLAQSMPKKDLHAVLRFAKYVHVSNDDRMPEDDDDF